MQNVSSEGGVMSQIYYANSDVNVTALVDTASDQNVDIT